MRTLAGTRAGRLRRGFCAVAALIVVLVAAAVAWHDGRSRDRRPQALLVGNSLTYGNGLRAVLQAFARADPGARELAFAEVAHGGWSLSRHWRRGEAPALLRARRWELVVLQEWSRGPIEDPEGFRDAATGLAGAARLAGARVVLYQTFARADMPGDQALLTAGYAALGRELGVDVAPVGEAWRIARARLPGVMLHQGDGLHPTPEGSYLAACVLHATIHRRSAVGLPRCAGACAPDAQLALALQRIADEAVDAVQ